MNNNDTEWLNNMLGYGCNIVINYCFPIYLSVREIKCVCGTPDGEYIKKIPSLSLLYGGIFFKKLLVLAKMALDKNEPISECAKIAVFYFLLMLSDDIQSKIFSYMGNEYFESDGHYAIGATVKSCTEFFRKKYYRTPIERKKIREQLQNDSKKKGV